MRNKKLILGLAVVVVIIIGIVLVNRLPKSKGPGKKTPVAAAKAVKEAAKAPVKKTFSKDMGGLTIRLMNSKEKEMSVRAKAFKAIDRSSSIYAATLVSNRLQELRPGTYDIELDTVPQTIYKNINVSQGKETVCDIGCVTGSVNVKALNSKKKDSSNAVRILYATTNIVAAAGSANRPLELVAGAYDVEIDTLPKQIRKDVRVEKAKETLIDLGCVAGSLNVKTADENKKDVRQSAKIKRAENGEPVTAVATNRPVEIMPGSYDIEIATTPPQVQKGVKIEAGEEVNIEFVVQSPPVPPAKAKK